MTDKKDFIYSFILYLEEGFKDKYLAQFPEELFGEPQVWDGINLHTFYELFGNKEKALYIKGNVPASYPPKEIVISAKIVPEQKRVEAAQCCSNWRRQNSLYTETVEEVVLSIFRSKQWNVHEGFPLTDEGINSALERILTEIPKINSI